MKMLNTMSKLTRRELLLGPFVTKKVTRLPLLKKLLKRNA
jgi:hypothetical protein